MLLLCMLCDKEQGGELYLNSQPVVRLRPGHADCLLIVSREAITATCDPNKRQWQRDSVTLWSPLLGKGVTRGRVSSE